MTDTGTTPPGFIQIDEEGYFKIDDLRIADPGAARQWFTKLQITPHGNLTTTIDGKEIVVEAFDDPFVALDVTKEAGLFWKLTMPYNHVDLFLPETLTLDQWDRFHGTTESGIPFVFSRQAQLRFFDLVDTFDDDSVTIDGERIANRPWLIDNPDSANAQWWGDLYAKKETGWNLEAPHPTIAKIMPRLKLQKSRILVAGCGRGHDAAWFAEQGHLVTALDFSPEAIAGAKEKYGHLPNLQFQQADVFKLSPNMTASFDVVFEHTLFCAIEPSRRDEMIRMWRRVLVEGGHLMGIFFASYKQMGPPFGGSEWELRERLLDPFLSLYWTRIRDSIERRRGTELFVYAQKRSRM